MLQERRAEFERVMMPHLGAAHNLARWLMRHPQEAEDAVQEAYLKAFRAFDGYAGGNAKAWIFAITRNTCMTRLSRLRSDSKVVVLDRHDLGSRFRDGRSASRSRATRRRDARKRERQKTRSHCTEEAA